MTPNHITKLKILLRRKEAELDRVAAKAKREVDIARDEYEKQLREFQDACKEAGLCVGCLKPLSECHCVWMAEGVESL